MKPSRDLLPHEKQILEYEQTIHQLKTQNAANGLMSREEVQNLEEKVAALKQKVYSQLSPWERVQICRHSKRPHSMDYIKALVSDFIPLHGDRYFSEDRAIVGGIGRIGAMHCVVIGQEKGADTTDRVRRNFGMPHPEGFRKALRLMRLAEKFNLPVVSFIDTAGAYPGLTAEERGQAWAIAENLKAMARLNTIMLVAIIGEASSGGALAMAMGDSIGILEHAYYSVISPEGCASILWKDSSKQQQAAATLKMMPENVLELNIVDEIIPEPLGGAHVAPEQVFAGMRHFLLSQWESLKEMPLGLLLERRYLKFRRIGQFIVE